MAGLKIAGYILALAGLGAIALSNQIAKLLGFLGSKALVYTVIGSVVLIAAGIALVLSERQGSYNVKHAAEQVPIYEGEGRNRKIVGYQKAK